MPKSLVMLVLALTIVWISEFQPVMSSPSANRDPAPALTGIKLFLHNTFHAIARALRLVRDDIIHMWNCVVNRKRKIEIPHGCIARNLSENHTVMPSAPIDEIVKDGTDDLHTSSSRSLQQSHCLLNPQHLNDVIGNLADYERFDPFVLEGYNTDEILQALRHDNFLNNVCLRSAEGIELKSWIPEGPWYRRMCCGKTRKEMMVQPEFKQTHRYGYLSENSAVYIIDQQVYVNFKMMSATFYVTVIIHIDPLSSSTAQLSVALKITASGSRLILMRGLPKAKELARIDYRNVQPVVSKILESNIAFRRPDKGIVVEELDIESPQSSNQYDLDASSEPDSSNDAESSSAATPELLRTQSIYSLHLVSAKQIVSSLLAFLLSLSFAIVKLSSS